MKASVSIYNKEKEITLSDLMRIKNSQNYNLETLQEVDSRNLIDAYTKEGYLLNQDLLTVTLEDNFSNMDISIDILKGWRENPPLIGYVEIEERIS